MTPDAKHGAPLQDHRGDPEDFLEPVHRRFSEVAELDNRLSELRVAASGLEFVVLRGRTSRWGTVAIRVPWARFFHNENDPWIDARQLLEQEARLLAHAARLGLPVPQVFGLHFGACDMLLTEFIDTDGSQASEREMGEILRRLHEAEPPDWTPFAQRAGDLGAVLAERLVRRCEVVRRRSGRSFQLPPKNVLARLLSSAADRRRLLHMDFRAANLLVNEGRIRGIVDWSNTIVGDPALELARVAEYNEVGPDFLGGYGTKDFDASVARPLRLAYRLDTAAMLGVVFLSEAPDMARAPLYVNRVVDLASALTQELG